MFCKETLANTNGTISVRVAASIQTRCDAYDGGLCGAAAQRGDGAAAAAHRALPPASHGLREPLPEPRGGAAGDGAAADLRVAPAVPADQGQAVEQAPAARGSERGARGAQRHQRRGRCGGARGAEQEQHADRGECVCVEVPVGHMTRFKSHM